MVWPSLPAQRRTSRAPPSAGGSIRCSLSVVAYAGVIARSLDDLAAQLGRILEARQLASGWNTRFHPDGDTSPVSDDPQATAAVLPIPEPAPAPRTPLDELGEQLDAAFEEVVDKLGRLERRMEEIRISVKAQGEIDRGADERATRAVGHIQQLLAGLDHALTSHLAANRAPDPADMASLRGDVEALTEGIRVQEQGIGELRTTLDWIKEQLLPRSVSLDDPRADPADGPGETVFQLHRDDIRE